jgi:hypothetical protein
VNFFKKPITLSYICPTINADFLVPMPSPFAFHPVTPSLLTHAGSTLLALFWTLQLFLFLLCLINFPGILTFFCLMSSLCLSVSGARDQTQSITCLTLNGIKYDCDQPNQIVFRYSYPLHDHGTYIFHPLPAPIPNYGKKKKKKKKT